MRKREWRRGLGCLTGLPRRTRRRRSASVKFIDLHDERHAKETKDRVRTAQYDATVNDRFAPHNTFIALGLTDCRLHIGRFEKITDAAMN